MGRWATGILRGGPTSCNVRATKPAFIMRASRLISSSHEDLAGDLGDATELLRLRASPNLLMNGTLRRWIPAKLQPHPISWA